MGSTVQTAPATIDAKLIVPFINSVRGVFSTMVGVQTTVNRPFLKADPSPTHDVSSIIGFSGEVVGSVVVTFQNDAAARLASAFAGTDVRAGTTDFADALGEL